MSCCIFFLFSTVSSRTFLRSRLLTFLWDLRFIAPKLTSDRVIVTTVLANINENIFGGYVRHNIRAGYGVDPLRVGVGGAMQVARRRTFEMYRIETIVTGERSGERFIGRTHLYFEHLENKHI